MEFSFKVTESEFKRAWKLERKASSRSSLKNAIFWILVMLGLMLLYRMIASSGHPAGISDQRAVVQALLSPPVHEVAIEPSAFEHFGPILVIAGIWFLLVGWMVPMRLRHLYRKDPRMQGEFTVNITPDWIATENSAGTTSKTAWNVYECWCESKGIIVLRFYSGSYSMLSLAGLAEPQRDELRRILAGALREKVAGRSPSRR